MSAVIQSMAWRTPLGDTIEGVLDALVAGERTIKSNPNCPGQTYACQVAAPFYSTPGKHHIRVLSIPARHGYDAALQVWRDAGKPSGERVGLFAGIGGPRADWPVLMPALAKQTDDLIDTWQRGFRRLHPFWVLQHLSNNAHALLSIEIGARGEGLMFGGGNAGGQALEAAIHALEAGAIDTAVVMAYDSLLEPETLVAAAARGELLVGEGTGVVPGEAAAALVLSQDGSGPRVTVTTGADGSSGYPSSQAIIDVLTRLEPASWIDRAGVVQPDIYPSDIIQTGIATSFGRVGAADTLLRAIALSGLLQRGVIPGVIQPPSTQTAIGVCVESPGLVAGVHITLDSVFNADNTLGVTNELDRRSPT